LIEEFKNNFYDRYVSTHISERKGTTTLGEFNARSFTYQKQFGRLIPSDKSARILDVGCGNGSIIWWLQKEGYYNSFGIDVSKEQIEVGKSLGVKNIMLADLKEFLRASTNSYDLIVARDVIEHFEKESIIEILALCNLALKNNSRIILQAPNAESPFFGRIRYGDFTHEVAFSSSSMHQLLKMIGFQKVSCFPSGPIVSGVKSFMRVLVWKVIEWLYKFILYAEVGRSPIERIVTQNIIVVAEK